MANLVKEANKAIKKGLKKGSKKVKLELKGKVSALDLVEIMQGSVNVADIVINAEKEQITILLQDAVEEEVVVSITDIGEGTGLTLDEAKALVEEIDKKIDDEEDLEEDEEDLEEDEEDLEKEFVPEPSKKDKKKKKNKKNKKNKNK